MASRWTEFKEGLGRVVKAYSPEETRAKALPSIDGLLDQAIIKAFKFEAVPGATTVRIGDIGEGRELVVTDCRFAERWRIGERLLTGRRTTQPVVALVENNGAGRVVTPLPYAEDLFGLPQTLPGRVIGCLRAFY